MMQWLTHERIQSAFMRGPYLRTNKGGIEVINSQLGTCIRWDDIVLSILSQQFDTIFQLKICAQFKHNCYVIWWDCSAKHLDLDSDPLSDMICERICWSYIILRPASYYITELLHLFVAIGEMKKRCICYVLECSHLPNWRYMEI